MPAAAPNFRILAAVLSAAAALAAASPAPAGAANPGALWHVVHDLCVRDKRFFDVSSPCASVDLAHRSAVLKDAKGKLQFLLIPTDRIAGIEAPRILEDGVPNYWQAAWDARRFLERRAGRPIPREDIALAINSPAARSQNQLHIHIDCVRADVRDALKAQVDMIGPAWADIRIDGSGRRYQAMRLDGEDLGARDPFRLLADADPEARADMTDEALAVIPVAGADGQPGFVLISERADPAAGHRAAGENLMDHQCAVLAAPLSSATPPPDRSPNP